MNSNRIIITTAGEVKLRAELKRLKSKDRPQVIAAIAEARAHGDLSENAEYDAAKEQQGFIEGRIKELESSLSIAEVIDPVKIGVDGKVVFGAYIELYDIKTEAEVTYQLVGDLETDLDNGKISISSPVGRALIGKQEGDEIVVKAPGGDIGFEILSVQYK